MNDNVIILSDSDELTEPDKSDVYRQEIDRILASDDDNFGPSFETAAWTPRPKHWRDMIPYLLISWESALSKFPEFGLDDCGNKLTFPGLATRRKRWIKDYQMELATGNQRNPYVRIPHR